MSVRAFCGWLVALVLVVLSGIRVTFSAHEVRQHHVELQSLQRQRDQVLEEYSRLQLELAAIAAYQNVERTAEERLDMVYPIDVERVEP